MRKRSFLEEAGVFGDDSLSGGYADSGSTPADSGGGGGAAQSTAPAASGGSDVRSAANALIASPSSASGSYDPLVLAFQQAYNAANPSATPLGTDGKYGPHTHDALAQYGTALPIPVPGGPAPAGTAPFGSLGPAASGQFLPSVIAANYGFQKNLEGDILFMYKDAGGGQSASGLVSVGVGFLVDSPDKAWEIPGWVRVSDGQPATKDEVTAAWNAVNNLPNGPAPNWKSYKAWDPQVLPANNVKLTPEAMAARTKVKTLQMTSRLLSLLPNAASWPADAQQGLLGIAWAFGPDGTKAYMGPFFTAAKANDFKGMLEAVRNTGHGTGYWEKPPITAKRKAQLDLLFSNAVDVVSAAGDYTLLNWPTRVTVGDVAKAAVKGAAVGVGGYLIGGFLFYGIYRLILSR